MSSFDLAAPAGTELVGERTLDECGSTTADQGGLDDAHVTGYECILTRQAVYIVPGPIGIEEEAAALESARPELLERLGAGDIVVTVTGANDFKLGPGEVIRGHASIAPADETQPEIYAQWGLSGHANKTLVSETGALTDKLVQDTDSYRTIYLELSYRYVESDGALRVRVG